MASLVFDSQSHAKRFFVDRVVAEAITEGSSLSDAERQMLGFSESDPDFVVEAALVDRLAAEISDEDYEAKVAGLLARAYKGDVARDPSARDTYREAYTVLKQGDHYLLVMIDRALGPQLRPWWAFWR
jgi:hypothetical protein